MTLEVRSGASFLASHRARLLQVSAVAVLALAWWRGEAWLADTQRGDENTVDVRRDDALAVSTQAALGLATVDVVVGAGDTLERIFRKLELSITDLATLRALPDLRSKLDRLYPGESLKFGVRDSQVFTLERKLSPSETLSVKRDAQGFDSTVLVNPLEREPRYAEGVISQSLFQAAAQAGLTDSLALRIAEVFQWDIDFVLDIQPGDRFRVLYEEISQDGERLGESDPLAVEFINQGQIYRAVRFETETGKTSYYTPEGKSLRKAFLRAPVDFTRVSSRFNLFRRHPILNRMRAHRGVDYAAPIGTPVKAAGAGRVRFVGNKGGYGKVIEIEHANAVRTVYGHLSRFKSGLGRGDRVAQGEIIGFVGMTGLATGPHLHYEYLVRGIHKDPQKVPLPNDPPLPPARLADFRLHAQPLLASLSSASTAPWLAARRDTERSDRTLQNVTARTGR
ncbi:MAG: peptidoglycan DD-metalloendopeptidase family protein [Steroidobacteraceae bacterium]